MVALTQDKNDNTAPVETTVTPFMIKFPEHYSLMNDPLDGVCATYTKP